MTSQMGHTSAMPAESSIESDVAEVLRLLAARKNVLISGPPGTGKSRILAQVRHSFEWDRGGTGADPYAQIPIPARPSPIPEWFPSPDRSGSRLSFVTVFDQNTKYRDFMRGIVPQIGRAGEFAVTSGTLYRASLHALGPANAALVVVDEVNRGPAVAVFGSAMVGLEADKRLDSSGRRTSTTQEFEVLGDGGEHASFALPKDLYILAAMNEADSSVEPLDVAFLRRFAPYRLEPQSSVLRKHLALPPTPGTVPGTPGQPTDVYEALAQAWEKLNKLILLGRGAPYRLGHGALMHSEAPVDDLTKATEYVSQAWATLRGHLEEVFFGNTRAIIELLRAEDPNSPYRVDEAVFAGQSVRRVIGPERPQPHELYALLAAIAAA